MTLYDSSLLIDYLDGRQPAVEYITARSHERAIAPPLVMFEVYQGEVFSATRADFDAVEHALQWLDVIESPPEGARAAAALQESLQAHGTTLAARDAFIAGIAQCLDERLAVSDSDFAVDGLTDVITVDFCD